MKQIIFLILLFSSSVHASDVWKLNQNPLGDDARYTSPQSACNAFYDQNENDFLQLSLWFGQTYYCETDTPGYIVSHAVAEYINEPCPTGSQDDGSGQCIVVPVDPCEPLQGTSTAQSLYPENGATSVCSSGCTAAQVCTPDTFVQVIHGLDNFFRSCHIQYYSDSSECSGAEPTTYAELPQESCAAGQISGTFNGAIVCMAPDGTAQSTEPPTVTTEAENTTVSTPSDNGDGTSTQTTITSTTVVGSGGATSTQTTTSTTVTDNATGEIVSQQSDTTTTEHPDPTPDDTDTPPESTFADNGCDLPVSCSGDVILCAIAQSEHDQLCLSNPPNAGDITAISLGISVEDQTPIVDTIIDLSTEIDTGTFLVSDCPAPRTIQLGSAVGSIEIDYAPFCELAEIVGTLVIFTAAIISIRTVGGS